MKLYINIFSPLSMLFLLMCLFACTKSDQTPALTNIQNSILDPLPFQEVTLQEADADDTLFTITWSATEFFVDGSEQATAIGPVTYTVQIALAGTNFEHPEVLTETGSLSVDITTAALNNLLKSKFVAQSSTPIDLEFRVLTRYGANNAAPIISGNSTFLTATVFEASDVMQPIYLVGDMNGWDNRNTDYIAYRESNDANSRIYTYTGKLGAGIYFKFMPQEALGTYKMYSRVDETTMVYETLEGGAFYNEQAGYYTITLNLDAMTYTIEPYSVPINKTYSKIGPIGDFCGWDNEPAMTQTTYDPHQWQGVFTFDAGTTVKFRGNNDWANNWGGNAADLPWGLAIFDGPGAAVPTGSYHIYFNDLTGRYTIWPQ